MSREVRLSSADRVLFPRDGITKGDLWEYYDAVADALVPHLRDRPFTMKRWREGLPGGSFFQKQVPKGTPSWLKTRRFTTRQRDGTTREVDFALVDSREAVLWTVQMHCIDMNAWYSRVDKPHRPDWVLFDIDPPDDEAWPVAVEVAHLIRGRLQELGLESWVKTSGSTGIHVVVPIARRSDVGRHVRVRRARRSWPRGGASRDAHDRMAEDEADRRPRRPPPERLGQDDRVRLLGAAAGRRPGVDAAAVGGADAGPRLPGARGGPRRSLGSSGTATCSRPCSTAASNSARALRRLRESDD